MGVGWAMTMLMLMVMMVKAIPPPILEHEYVEHRSNDPDYRYVQLIAGQDLRIKCTGHSSAEWTTPNNTALIGYSSSHLETRLQIEKEHDIGQATLIISDLRVTDTGTYTCHDQSAHDNAELYVYVTTVNDRERTLSVRENQHVIIPCRVTDPMVNVRLFVGGRRMNSDTAPFDPRIGFRLQASEMGTSAYSGLEATCSIGGEGEEEKFIVIVVHKPTALVPPVISTSHDHPYSGLQQFNLTCITASPGYRYTSYWTCPLCAPQQQEQQLFLPSNNRYSTTGYSKSGSAMGKGKNGLSISNVSMEDQGPFTCVMLEKDENGNRELARITFNLTISATKGQILEEYSNQPSSRIAINPGEQLNITVTMVTWPIDEQYSVNWFKRYDTILPSETREVAVNSSFISSNIHIDGNGDEQKTIHIERLLIDRVTLSDTANYTMMMKVGGDLIHRLNFTVRVLDDRVEKIELKVIRDEETSPVLHNDLYTIGMTVTIQCIIRALPTIRHSLSMRHCIGTCSDPWTIISSNANEQGTIDTLLQWNTMLNQSMTIQCEACRQEQGASMKKSTTTKQLIVTDLIEGIVLKKEVVKVHDDDHSSMIYVGDTMLVICVVPRYNLGKVTMRKKSKNGNGNGNDNGNGNGIMISDNLLEMSLNPLNMLVTYRIRNVQQNASGEYTCQFEWSTTNVSTPSLIRNINITVNGIRAPHNLRPSSQEHIKATYGKERLILHCPIESIPSPIFSWYKNGTRLVNAESDRLIIEHVFERTSGIYTCLARNRLGQMNHTIHVATIGGPNESTIWIALAVVLGIVTVLVLILLVLLCRQRRRYTRQKRQLYDLHSQLMEQARVDAKLELNPDVPVNRQPDQLPYNPKYELVKNRLKLKEVLGSGQFGKVYRGELLRVSDNCDGQWLDVAVKTPKIGRSISHQKALLDELKVMIAIGTHCNVLALVGAVTKQMARGELFVVTELCALGNLLEYVRKNSAKMLDELVKAEEPLSPDGYLAPRTPIAQPSTRYKAETEPDWAAQVAGDRTCLTTTQLISFGYQVANGMLFLSDRTLIHRDLAARNCLLTGDRIVKIADFGLARQDEAVYHIKASASIPLPVKWMALESLTKQDFCVESDVWSFGVVLWELFSLGCIPYAEIPHQNLIDHLKMGNRLSPPQHAPDPIYNLMRQCWLQQLNARPSFAEAASVLAEQLALASPIISERLHEELRVEERRIRQLSKWRDDVNDDHDHDHDDNDPGNGVDLRSEATRNGFIPVPTREPLDNPLYMQQTNNG